MSFLVDFFYHVSLLAMAFQHQSIFIDILHTRKKFGYMLKRLYSL